MVKQESTSKIPRETERQGAELEAMRRMLSASAGTCSLSISICNSPALRDYIIEKLRKRTDSIEVVKLTKDTTDIFNFVCEKVSGPDCSAIFITNIEPLLPSDTKEHEIVKALNASRELWKDNYHCPIVFWVAEYVAALISIQARDIWSWISHQFEFISEESHVASGMGDMFAGNILAAGNLPIDQKQFRIAELEQRITEAGETFKPAVAEHVLLWLNELAYIYYQIGDLSQAEHVLKKSLEIDERFGRQEGIAGSYGNLGLIYQMRGESDKAEEMFKKSLEIDESLGRQAGIANSYGNLGMIYQDRGELDKAEEMYKKSLEIDESLGHQEGIAIDYGNLGTIYHRRGELDKAEEMYKKSLEIDERLGRQGGIATQYGNLGQIHRTRGELDKAEEMYKKSFEINESLGRQDGVAFGYGNLGTIYQARDELDKAEEMYKKSLEINERLGRQDGMAYQYGNLGTIYQKRGDLDKAKESLVKARDLFSKIGLPHMVEKAQGQIEGLKEEGKDGR